MLFSLLVAKQTDWSGELFVADATLGGRDESRMSYGAKRYVRMYLRNMLESGEKKSDYSGRKRASIQLTFVNSPISTNEGWLPVGQRRQRGIGKIVVSVTGMLIPGPDL